LEILLYNEMILLKFYCELRWSKMSRFF